MSSVCWPRVPQHSPPAARGGEPAGRPSGGPRSRGAPGPASGSLSRYPSINLHPGSPTVAGWPVPAGRGPGWRCWSTGLALACLWRPSGPCMGKPGPVPMWMAVPTPDSPLSPICSSGASGCPARGDGQRARPGTRAGSQAQPARLKPQPGAPGLCPPRPAGAETHLGIQVANHRDKLRNDK